MVGQGMQVRSNPDLHFALRVIVPAAQAESGVGLPLGLGVRVTQDVDHAAGLGDKVDDLLFGQALGAAGAGDGAEAGFGPGALGLALGDPPGDEGGRAGVGGGEGLAIAGEFTVAGGDLGAGFDLGRLIAGRGTGSLGGVESLDGGGAVAGGEEDGEPAVEGGNDVRFPEEDVARVGDLVGQRVLLRVAAAVVGLLVDPVASHLPIAQDTGDPATQEIGVDGTDPIASGVVPTAGEHDLLDLLETFTGEQGRVGDPVRPDPLLLGRGAARHCRPVAVVQPGRRVRRCDLLVQVCATLSPGLRSVPVSTLCGGYSMAIELPGEVVSMLQFIGVNWPNVNEDKVRELASHVREFADCVDGTHQKATGTVSAMAADYQGGSYEALVSNWAHLSSSHMSDLVGACHTVATALDAAADVIVAMKMQAVAELAALAVTFVADQAAAVATLGLAEAGMALIVEGAEQITDYLEQQLEQYVIGQVIEAAITPLVAVVAKAVNGLAFSAVAGILGASGSADSGGTGFKIDPAALEDHAETMNGHAQEVAGHAEALRGKLAGVDFT
ncbi:WXG100-like domain-containing protein [Kitasatospora mediocidica]